MARKGVPQEARRAVLVRASDEEKSEEVEYNKEFGYSRKDVLLIRSWAYWRRVLFQMGP